MGVHSRPSDQQQPVEEAFLLHIQEPSHLQVLFLMGDFNQLDICWESNTAGCKQCRRLLERVEHNFLVQVLVKAARAEALLDLVLTNVDELTKGIKIGSSLSCGDHAPAW